MSEPQAAGETTSTKDSANTGAAPATDEAGNELISPRRMKYALKKENSTAEGYVSMIRSKSDRHMQANGVNGSAEVKIVRQSSSEALVGGSDKKSPSDPEGEVRPRAQTVGTVAVNGTIKQTSPRGEPEPPKTARGDLEKRERKEKEKDKEKEKEKHKRTHTKKPSMPNLTLDSVKTTAPTTAATNTSKHESKRDKRDKKDKKDKHTKRSETIASPRHQPAQVVTEEPKVRFGEPQVKFTEPVRAESARETASPVVVETPKTPSAQQLLNTSNISGPVVDLFVDHLIAQKGPLKKSIDQLIQTLLQEHEQATSKQLSEMKSKIEELTSENTKLKQELDALKKK
jgi:hypothetical protein